MQKWGKKFVTIKWLGSILYMMWHIEIGRNQYNLHKWSLYWVQKYKHIKIHKEAWIIPGTMVTNQMFQSTQDYPQPMQGPNCDTDHVLVTVKHKQKIMKISQNWN